MRNALAVLVTARIACPPGSQGRRAGTPASACSARVQVYNARRRLAGHVPHWHDVAPVPPRVPSCVCCLGLQAKAAARLSQHRRARQWLAPRCSSAPSGRPGAQPRRRTLAPGALCSAFTRQSAPAKGIAGREMAAQAGPPQRDLTAVWTEIENLTSLLESPVVQVSRWAPGCCSVAHPRRQRRRRRRLLRQGCLSLLLLPPCVCLPQLVRFQGQPRAEVVSAIICGEQQPRSWCRLAFVGCAVCTHHTPRSTNTHCLGTSLPHTPLQTCGACSRTATRLCT